MSGFIEVVGNSHEGLSRVTRLWLKSFMEQFGQVTQIHKPPTSGDPRADVATVRFAKQEHAEQAIAFLKTGTAVLNGVPIKGDWKSEKRGKSGRPSSGVLEYDAPYIDSRSILEGKRERTRTPPRDRDGRRADSRPRRSPPPRRDSRGRSPPRRPPPSRRSPPPRDARSPPRRSLGRSPSLHGRRRGSRSGSPRRRRLSNGRGAAVDGRRAGSGAGRSRSQERSPACRRSPSVRRDRSMDKDRSVPRPPRARSASPPARRAKLSAQEEAELAALRAAAQEEEQEMEELRKMKENREAKMAALQQQMAALDRRRG